MNKIDPNIFFTKGVLVSQVPISSHGLPTLICRMLAEMQTCYYWPLGQELKRSTIPEREEFFAAIMSGSADIALRISYIATAAEGFGEITSIEEVKEIITNLLKFLYLYRRISEVGWEPDFDRFSVLDDTSKVFKSISLKDLDPSDINEMNAIIDKELY